MQLLLKKKFACVHAIECNTNVCLITKLCESKMEGFLFDSVRRVFFVVFVKVGVFGGC